MRDAEEYIAPDKYEYVIERIGGTHVFYETYSQVELHFKLLADDEVFAADLSRSFVHKREGANRWRHLGMKFNPERASFFLYRIVNYSAGGLIFIRIFEKRDEYENAIAKYRRPKDEQE